MATLRLFAGLRDAAGTSRTEIPGATVGEVLDAAAARFGPSFAEGLGRARVWLNGEEAVRDDPVGDSDEVAVLPPVSGGAATVAPASAADLVAPLLAAATLVAANLTSGEAWWAAAVVGLVGLWVGDVAGSIAVRGRDIPVVPALLSILVAVVSVSLLGASGLGLALAGAVISTLAWGVASDSSRMLPSLSPALVLALVGAAAVGSLLHVRIAFQPGARVVGVYLAVVIAATVAGLVVERLARLPLGDPFSVGALGAVVTSLAAAAFWDLDLVAFLIVGIGLALALVAGRTLGSILRTRQVVLLERVPGMLAALDGPVLAAALYLPLLRLVLVT